ncbi:MAG TPA: hypothetical protein VL727_28990 [Puia sp.]|jgi:hypothetical protein|nr:hypothetical protein [Puia sp.]
MFSQKSCTELKALPDYSHFLFTSRGIAGSTTREVRFIRQKDTFPNDIFNLEIGDFRPEGESPAEITDNGDMNYVLTTLIMIIELYLERYPERTIRLKGNTREISRLYRVALDMHVDVLKQHFEICMEEDKRTFSPRGRHNFDNIGFLIRRRPGVRFTLHSIQTTRTSRSLLFGKTVSVEIQRSIELGLITVECEA